MPKLSLLTLILTLFLAFSGTMLTDLHAESVWGGMDRYETQESDLDPLEEKSVAPDFTLPDINDADFTLSSLRGKYVILDFWGTWCGWCVKSMPKMKEYYEKYKGKVEIVGVDCGDAPERWKAAVQVLKLPWTNVKVGRDNGVSRLYRVKGFPTKVIIDPEGKIVKVISGEDQRFYALMDKMFK